MFTGIVEYAGQVHSLTTTANGCQLTIDAGPVAAGVQPGDSIANNGCCLTVTNLKGSLLSFDLLEETRRATNLGDLRPGRKINLERSLTPTSRLGGHFVTGHIDSTGHIIRWEPEGSDYILEIEVLPGFERYIVPKGCIAIDGISLTIGRVHQNRFNVWIIPHTLAVTALGERQVGDRVNLEFDLLAKYAEKLLASRIR
ncbi:MAG: riboflavin synthase [Candidatus Methylacidiphilales bacterium]